MANTNVNVGGVVGANLGTVNKCSNEGAIVTENDSFWVGGVCGYVRYWYYNEQLQS